MCTNDSEILNTDFNNNFSFIVLDNGEYWRVTFSYILLVMPTGFSTYVQSLISGVNLQMFDGCTTFMSKFNKSLANVWRRPVFQSGIKFVYLRLTSSGQQFISSTDIKFLNRKSDISWDLENVATL